MKKLLVVLFIIILSSALQAQFIRGYGIKVGATISSQDWEYSNLSGISSASFDSDNRLGLNIGVYAELLNIPFFSVVAELNYLQKGMELDGPITTVDNPIGTSQSTTWDTRIDYINLSALGKLRLNYGLLSPYIVAGPKMDFEINKESSFGSENEVESKFEENRLGFKVGVGTEIKLLAFNVLAEIIYDADFNELFENENLKVNTNSFDLRVGLLF